MKAGERLPACAVSIPTISGSACLLLQRGKVIEAIPNFQQPATTVESENSRVGTNITNKLVQDLPLVVAGRIRNVSIWR